VAPRVAVAVLSLAAGTAKAGENGADGAPRGLRLVWFDPSEVAAGTGVGARAETTKVLARLGASVSWRPAGSGEIQRSDGVWIVLLGEGPAAPGPPVLGATRKHHSVAPVAWVRVPNVRSAVGVARSGPLLGADRDCLAVALGRVIAHEVVHALVPSLGHGGGLMSQKLDRLRLTAPSITVDPEAASAVQAVLRRDPVAGPAGPGVLAAAHEDGDH
jgi:hypothetical protein